MKDRRSIRIKDGGAVRARGGIGGALLAGAWIVVILALIGGVFWVRSQPDGEISGRTVWLSLPPASPERTEELMRPAEAKASPPTAAVAGPSPAVSPQVGQPQAQSSTAEPATALGSPAPLQQADLPGGPPLPTQTRPDGQIALARAPDPALTAASANGLLPVIAPDGRRAWRAYARPFSAPAGTPRAALVLEGLGLNEAATKAAIENLPGTVTLSFLPYAHDLQPAIDRARAFGHEVLIELPMEPFDFPQNDPGPSALRTDLTPPENLAHLDWMLARGAGYVGAMNYLGAKFMASPGPLQPVLAALNARGLLFFDSHSSVTQAVRDAVQTTGIPFVSSDVNVDENNAGEPLSVQLAKVTTAARQSGHAVGVAGPYPATINEVATWTAGLQQQGVALAPLSAFAAPLQPSTQVRNGG